MKFKSWKDIINERTPLKLLYFYTDWCENCEKQKEVLEKIPNWEDFSYTEINADERPDLAVRYSPQIYPSISIITDNNLVGGLYGYNDSQKIEETMLITLDLLNGGGKLFSKKKTSYERRSYTISEAIELIKRNCLSFFDIYYGGFEKEPKYYLPNVLRFLLRNKDPYSLEVVKYTIDAAIYNLWDEGFYAYAKSYDWREPSREKLLDINSEMVIALLETYEKTTDKYYLDYAIETGKWILRQREEEFYPIAIVNGQAKGGYFMTVNSEIGEMFYLLYKYSKNPEFLKESERLSRVLPDRLSHNLEKDSPLFLIDVAYLLRFLSSVGKGTELIPKIKEMFSGEDAFYDVPLSLANEEKIGRFKLITDNSILAQAFLNLGIIKEAKNIAEFFLSSFYNYTYFSQADYGTLLVMMNEII